MSLSRHFKLGAGVLVACMASDLVGNLHQSWRLVHEKEKSGYGNNVHRDRDSESGGGLWVGGLPRVLAAIVAFALAGSLCLSWVLEYGKEEGRGTGDIVQGRYLESRRGQWVGSLSGLLVDVACAWAGDVCWRWGLGLNDKVRRDN